MPNHDLAEDLPAGVVGKRRFGLREWKHAVNHGAHDMRIDRAAHRFGVDAASDADAAERRLTHEQADEIQTAFALGECPDECDLAAIRHRLQRLRQRPRPTDVNDPIDASPGRQRAYGVRPLRVLDVVDNGVGAERLQPVAIPRAGLVAITRAPSSLAS
jgi:hypothetical protein